MTDAADTEPQPGRRRRRVKKRWLTAGSLVVLVGILWLAREPIADKFVREKLDELGVPATYTIDRIGFRTERISNVVIGDPKRPDLTARTVEISLGYGWGGPYVSSIAADGVRLYGRFADGRLSLGALDKFRDPTSTDPFALPDLAATLTDARARVETPWGDIGAALSGRGHLQRNFAGTLALVAPRVSAAGCTGSDLSFYGPVTIRSLKPRLVGPLRGRSLACADGSVTATSPQIALDVALGEDLTSWDGKADAALTALAAGPMRAERVALLATFKGNATKTALTFDGEALRLAGPDFAASRVDLDATGEVGKAAPKLAGTLTFARAAASTRLRQSLAASTKNLDGTPIGPLASKATSAIAAMLTDVGGKADFALAGEGDTARLELLAPDLVAESGARLTGNPDSRIAYLYAAAAPAFTIQGGWAFGGGGLPEGTLALDRRADGSLSGLARLDPYEAGGARLALLPVRFSGGQGGAMRFATTAELSGPLADGRVERLRIPLDGALSSTGTLTLAGGCSRIAADRLSISGFRLAAPALDLCSRAGQPLLAAGAGGLKGQIRIPRIVLRGTSGTSPFAFTSGPGDIDLATLRWTLALADVRLGEGETATRFSAQRLGGRSTPQGMAGDLTGAAGKIGAVPLNMSEIGGKWSFANGTLGLDGALVLTDAEPEARFAPLIANSANLRFANGTIDATAAFNERTTGTHVLDTVIQHRLATGTGHADLKVAELRFNDNFQPDQLSRLALGIVANVQGSVVGDGRIDWSPAGVTSRGTFATANTNLAAAFGPVTGATTTLVFDDLIGLKSASNQTISLAEVNPGIPVTGGEIEYQLLGDNRVRIQGGSWPFAGGRLELHPTTLNFNADQPRRLTFDLVGVDAAIFLQNFGFENINATGKFDGTLPVEFDGLGGRIVNGRIDARDGGGTLAYVGELSNHDLGAMANFAFGALRSLKYDDLTIVLNGDLDGEMVTDIRFGGIGQGEGATQNFITRQVAKLPFVFNIKIQAPFRQLITSAKGLYDPTVYIEQNLGALIQAQQDADAAANNPPTVQPPASEPVQ
jgi:translocation and assembly module TamB